MNLEYFTQASFAIQIHIITAFAALILGMIMWQRPKGTRSHKMVGRVFVIFMIVTAISAIFIRQINDGSFSLIHLFVILTFTATFELFYGIRKGNIKMHKRAVKGLFFGALLIPGFLSFMPGRTMYMIVFG